MMPRRQYLQYIENTAGNATVAQFDDDWEPIGPMVRRDIIPMLAEINEGGFLVLTERGHLALQRGES